jgi:DNA-binding NarL/FixJ family response regulator
LIGRFRYPAETLPKASPRARAKVCLFSFHPLVLPEIQRLAEGDGFQFQARTIDQDQMPSLETVSIPRAAVYVIDAHARPAATEALAAGILAAHPTGRLVAISEKLVESRAFALLRLGVKGLLTYSDAAEQLTRALRVVAGGGYWVPRTLLSRFVEASLTTGSRRPLITAAGDLTRREREVLEALLENLSNKEIASRLQVSERTAKFHVSNLLAKFGVRRRADLILLNFTQADGR